MSSVRKNLAFTDWLPVVPSFYYKEGNINASYSLPRFQNDEFMFWYPTAVISKYIFKYPHEIIDLNSITVLIAPCWCAVHFIFGQWGASSYPSDMILITLITL